jgi:hypothetical protein
MSVQRERCTDPKGNAHRTGAGVGPLAENLPTSHASAASGAHHGSSGVGITGSGQDAVSGAYESGPIRGDALTGESEFTPLFLSLSSYTTVLHKTDI